MMSERRSRAARPTGVRLILAALLALSLSGCPHDTGDLERYIAEVKARPGSPLEPIPEVGPLETHVYPDEPLRDPFARFGAGPPAPPGRHRGPQPDPSRPRELLEQFPLDTLRMVGILQRQDRLWALIRDPRGIIHRVQTGNYLGQNHGRIVAISESQVLLQELVADGAGGWIERKAVLGANE